MDIIPYFNQPPLSQPRPQKPKTPKPGTLLIQDTFRRSGIEAPHGVQVFEAAKSTGFKGPVSPNLVPDTATGPATEIKTAQTDLGHKSLTRKQALAHLTKIIETQASSLLNDQSTYLERMTKIGTRNSAANFSLGFSKASSVLSLYDKAASSLGDRGAAAAQLSYGPKTMENYATAFGLDPDKLKSKDPKVHGPERKKLQEALIEHVSKTVDQSKTIAGSRKRWDRAVSAFEARHNSVVISAGNEGGYAELLASENGNLKIKVPADFEKNLLENDAVTSVGATEVQKTKETRAGYSSISGGVDVYANGTLGKGPYAAHGTSFSAPQVAALMAQLHKDHPGLSSAQIENLLRNRLTKTVPDGKNTIRILDYQKVRDYLSKAD